MREPSKSPNGPERPGEPAAVQEAVDRRLREALEPPSGTAERIARRALVGEARPARAWVVRPAVAGLTLVAVALVALLLPPRLDRPDGRDGPGGVEPGGATAASVRYSITNRGEVLVVQALDGGPSSLHSTRPRPERPLSPPGMKIIVLGGARP